MRSRFVRCFAIALIVLIASVSSFAAPAVFAQSATPSPTASAPIFSIALVSAYENGYIQYELKPGESTTFAVRVGVGGTIDG